jgi:SNF2 family DNA or RNA helicase
MTPQEQFNSLKPHEQKILQCYSIFDEEANLTEFNSLLSKLKLKDENGKAHVAAVTTQLVNKLGKNKILKTLLNPSRIIFESDDFKEYLIKTASEEDWFDEVCNTIKMNYSAESGGWGYYDRRQIRQLRNYRIAIYSIDKSYLNARLDPTKESFYSDQSNIIHTAFTKALSLNDLKLFSKAFQQRVLQVLVTTQLTNGENVGEYLKHWQEVGLSLDINFTYHQCSVLFLQGNFSEIRKIIGKQKELSYSLLSLLGLIEVIQGDYETAIKYYEEALKIWKKIMGKKKGYPVEWSFLGYGLALYKIKESSFYAFYKEYEKYGEKNFTTQNYVQLLGGFYYYLTNEDTRSLHYTKLFNSNMVFQTFWFVVVASNLPKSSFENKIPEILFKAQTNENKLIEREILYYISQKSQKLWSDDYQKRLEVLNKEIGTIPLGNFIPQVEDWQRSLSVLMALGDEIEGKKSKTETDEPAVRMVWLVNFDSQTIQPVQQKRNKTGWSSGQNMALKRLYNRDYDFLTPQDLKVISQSLEEQTESGGWGYYGSVTYDFNWENAILALIDHPNLFLYHNPTLAVNLTKHEVALQIKQSKEGLQVGFDLDFNEPGLKVIKETVTRYKVYHITPLHAKILRSFEGKSLNIPSAGKEALLKALSPLSKKLAIQSDLEEQLEDLPIVESDNRIYALLNPLNEGFHLEFFVKPFGSTAPYLKPGKGSENLVATVNGVRSQTKRNLKKERLLLKDVEENCPSLSTTSGDSYEWMFDSPEDCLQALVEIEVPKQKDKLVVEWPKGQKLKLMGNINFDNLKMNITSKSNWFEVSGEVKVDNDLVISLKDILQKLNSQSNFIELSDGQFVAITEKLRKHLQNMEAMLDDKMRGNNLSASMLEELSDEVKNFKADKIWKENIKKMKDIRGIRAEIPSTFQAELRPYQEEGYQWLSQLANWGVGACLADDMGLGKTIQALALMIQRADLGPALVVAPVSVCRNWEKEALRFAPTLNLQIVAGSTGRKEIIQNAGPFDVVVVSYGLLQTEEELFTQKKFATILLDEAQAIKNRTTKRSKTVMALDGDFKIITTGTPVENHLGELWNLFNFINPGFLGSHDSFQERFAIPIEKNQSLEKRKALQRLIKPFILRRRKNQVLDDLPAKTEIILNVEMSVEERSFYESVRLDALERIEADNSNTPDKRFRILAELTRLRLACCHPKLVNPDIPLSSSKLELFGEVMDELIENKHKALVFSQFTKHLAIIEEYLQAKNISYQYLDGSTPPAKRQERIDDFQRGKGDVFLISLKAGGTGLNLTAADYVIHLDPWWNPAVEDQATDRAHRMGQQRPVTVYRLVTEDTVEAKILKLHETKRDLADGLLEGSEGSGKMSADELMSLIRER